MKFMKDTLKLFFISILPLLGMFLSVDDALAQTFRPQYRAVYELTTKAKITNMPSPDLWYLDVDTDVLRFYSYYTYRKELLKDSVLKATNNIYETRDYIRGMRKGATDRYLFFPKEQKMLHLLGDLTKTYYEEKISDPQWKIGTKTKMVLDYLSQEAETEHEGRSWVVYYTDEIPLPYGPWKLQGLTGLVTEAYTTDSLFHFTLKGFEQLPKSGVQIHVIEGDYKGRRFGKKEAIEIRREMSIDIAGYLELHFLEGQKPLTLPPKYREKVEELKKAYEYFEK